MKAVDVVILTALRVEAAAVLSKLGQTSRHVDPRSRSIYRVGTTTASDGSLISVAVMEVGMGNPGAAAAAEASVQELNPGLIAFVGVAGGVKDAALGDVVVADKVYGYQFGKETSEGFLSRPEVYRTSSDIVALARDIAREEWGAINARPEVFVGAIAAGDRVVTVHQATSSLLHTRYNDTLAMEMESLGFLAATWRHTGIRTLVVRGISDQLEGKAESDKAGSQAGAAEGAAAFALAVIASAGALANPPPNVRTTRVYLPPRPDVLRGREQTIMDLEQQLGASKDGARTIVITGMPGVGKSAIASEVAHRLAAAGDGRWSCVWWIAMDSQASADSALSYLGSQVSEASAVGGDSKQEAMRWLASNSDWLMILDGATSETAVTDLLPLRSLGRILITSTSPTWGLQIPNISLSPLDDETSTIVVSEGLNTVHSDAKRIARILGGLPLALRQANRYMRESLLPATDYERLLNDKLADVLRLGATPDHPASVTATVLMAFDRAQEEGETSPVLLWRLASYVDATVPFDDFVQGSIVWHDGRVSAADLYADLAIIRRLGLIEADRVSVRMHNLTAKVLLTLLTDDEVLEVAGEAGLILSSAANRRANRDGASAAPALQFVLATLGLESSWVTALIHVSLAAILQDAGSPREALTTQDGALIAARWWVEDFGYATDPSTVLPPREIPRRAATECHVGWLKTSCKSRTM